MARLLPSTSSPDVDASPRVIGLDDDDADDLLSALSSGTARRILADLHEDPANAAALADTVDTSLQNVQYHLGRLEEAGAVEVVDTVYSEKGREMKVYAPSDQPLVVVAADREGTTGLMSALRRLLAAVGVVGVASFLVQWATVGLPFGGQTGSAGGDVSMMETARASDTAATAAGLPPGLLFFLGGISVILVWSLVWYFRRE
ncbi:transcriptional regulator, arsr family protein [Halogeometricum borinquense DSM 11551]|uniref:Transcriptional regulator, ArsR family n=2 Tax=Halogeometricum borinquense TaxID=60847 RepID=E4NLP2_HALBP|nr:winged helix-turn-helix domain-containing protein [Halogeometricum borinquense]ADQ67245.1 transcriptional regulator, ArsR family [Halogeometricum borinquense DSM 11551]ELY29579.1 transcriptional regulator, arsr family protein [Halogeometricum borinquense DSM 11551]RYJ13802.1 ArsR family transcriptional regulator [Halogeometricum borinquense]